MEHILSPGNGSRPWPRDEVVMSLVSWVGSLLGLSLCICICCSRSVQHSCPGESSHPHPSLSICLSVCLSSCLYHAVSWSPLSGECRVFPGVSSLIRIPLKHISPAAVHDQASLFQGTSMPLPTQLPGQTASTLGRAGHVFVYVCK